MRDACQMLPDPDWKAEDQRGSRARTSVGNNNDDDNQGSDLPSRMFKEESNREETKNRGSKKKPAQLKKNDNQATQDVKVLAGTTKGKCVAGPDLMRAQVKKSNKVHPLQVKEAVPNVDKSTIEDLQKKASTLKKCFDRVGKPIIRVNYVGEWITLSESSRDEDGTKFKPVCGS